MLYLNTPYFLINGVSIFPDHADPLQFYYLPMMPHLSTVTDSTGKVLPQISLIEYTGAAGTGGFLNFDVNLGIAPDDLADVAQQLKQQAKLSDNPRLSPVTFVDGTVKVLILGQQSPDPSAPPPPAGAAAATADPNGPRFVVKIQNASKPSLFGDNQATFSIQLDQYGVDILEKALLGEMAPVAIVYSLDFVALRPAFNVHLHIDWDRVHQYMDDHFSGGFLFFSADIDKSIDKLIESRVITIDVDTFVTDTDMSKSTTGDKDRAVAQVFDMIKDTFFTPSMPPGPGTAGAGGGDLIAAAETARTIAELAGGGGLALCSRKQVDLTQVDKKTLDVNISERTSVQRTIYPQGHLSGLFDTLRKTGVDLSRFITKVDLDNPWFQRRKLNVTTMANFDGDSIASIDVNLTYNNSIKSVTLTKDAPQAAVDWTSLVQNGQMLRPVTYTYTVNFRGDIDSAQRPSQIASPEMTAVGDALDIEPRADLYAVSVIPIWAANVPWDRYPDVQIDCRYVDDANGLKQEASAFLNSQNPNTSWTLFLRDRTKRAFEYRLTYALASGGTKITPWTSTDDGKVDIEDPYPSKLPLTVIAAVDWEKASQVIVYVAYPNKASPAAHQNYIFTSQTPAQVFTVERIDGQDTFYYEARIIGAHGLLGTVPGSYTSDTSLIIQDGMIGHNIVTVKPEQVDFAAKHISEIDVQLRYNDAKNAITAAASVRIAQASDTQQFAFDYINPAVVPEFRADIQLDNGQTKSMDWSPISGSTLTIPLAQLE